MNFLIRVVVTSAVGVLVWWAAPLVAIILFSSTVKSMGPVSPDQVEFWRIALFNLAPFAAMLFTWDVWKGMSPTRDQKKHFDPVRFSICFMAFIVFLIGVLQTIKWPTFPDKVNPPQVSKPKPIKL